MRLLLISIFVIFLTVLLTPNAFGVQYPVQIQGGVADNRGLNFSPSEIEIEKGDTIKWINLERGVYHTVTSASGLFDERLINCTYYKDGIGICASQQKSTFSYTFEESGTYDYNCKLHSWMNGVVKVIELGSDAELAVHGDAGVMFIEKSQYTVTETERANIKIYGKVNDPGNAEKPLFTITNPDGSIEEQRGFMKRNGEYFLELSITYEETGPYNVHATFGLENIGTASFVVVKRPNPTIENPFPPSDDESTNVIDSSSITITTDFQSYERGDKIKISGQVSRYLEHGLQLTLQMLDPQNNIVTISQTKLNTDGTYYMSINSNGPMFRTEGDYTIKVKYGTWDASTKFFLTIPNTFNPQSPAPSTQSKTSTLLILDSIPSTFEAQGQNSQAEVIVSGKLTSSDRQYVITSAIIQLKAEGHDWWGTVITTDGNGEFSYKSNWGVGNDYGVYAVFDGSSNFKSSKSQTEYFDVRTSSQSQSTGPTEDSSAAGGALVALLGIGMIVIIGIVIVVKKRKGKTLVSLPPPSGRGTVGTATIAKASKPRKTPRAGKAPLLMGKIRQAKRAVGRQSPKAKSKVVTMHYLRCKDCLNEELENEADGQQYCTKCGWRKK